MDLETKRMLGLTKRGLALELFEIGAFMDKAGSPEGKGFPLKLHEKNPDAPLSPFYLNLRTEGNPKPGPLTAAHVTAIGVHLFALAAEKRLLYDAVAGIPRAGAPLAKAFLLASPTAQGTKLLELEKAGGEGWRKISVLKSEDYVPGSRVLLVDDVSTQWESKFEAIRILEEHGLVVRDILVVVNREQKSFAGEHKRHNYQLHALFTALDLAHIYWMKGLIERDTYEEIRNYLES